MGGGEAVIHFSITIVGACLGVLMAGSRVPRIRWIPVLSTFILLMAAVVMLVRFQLTGEPLLDGLCLGIGALLASALYAGRLWQLTDPDPATSDWGWVWRDVSNPGYLRRSHQQALKSGAGTSAPATMSGKESD